MAWQSTSKPLAATTAAGSVAVASGSTTARVGRSQRDAMPVLALSASTSQTAMPVSCRRLGTLYQRGRGVAANRARAFELYDRACRAGDARGCALRDAADHSLNDVDRDDAVGEEGDAPGAEGAHELAHLAQRAAAEGDLRGAEGEESFAAVVGQVGVGAAHGRTL